MIADFELMGRGSCSRVQFISATAHWRRAGLTLNLEVDLPGSLHPSVTPSLTLRVTRTSAVAGVSSTTASYASTITSLAGVGLGVAEGVSIKRFGSMASLPVLANDIKVRVQSAARADEGGNQHALIVRVQSAAWALAVLADW